MLRVSASKAGIDKKITQHSFRKLFFTTAINLGIQTEIVKILTFKSVPQDILTYFLDREDLRKYWGKVVSVLSLEPKTNGRIDNVQEMTQLLAKVLMKLIQEERAFNPSSDKGFLTPREFLELYLKRKRNETM